MEKINNVYCIEGLMADSNSYLIDNSDGDDEFENILVDTGTGENQTYLYSKIKELGFNPEDISLIVNTHCHYDHVGGNYLFPNAKVAIHEEDAKSLIDTSSELTVTALFGRDIQRRDVDIRLKENDKIANFVVLHTPGHSNGGLCLYDGEILICGDTIFANGGVGRMDIGGNLNDMKNSLKKLKKLDVAYLLPGHGPWVNNANEHIKMSFNNIFI